MPFNELQRRDSWPPTILRIREDDTAEETSAIDENPFSFFLTSPEELDIDLDEDLSAGIESTSSPKSPQVREISPSAIQRSPLPPDDDFDEDNVEFGFAVPLSLKEFTLKHTDGRKSRQTVRTEDRLKGLGIEMPAFHVKRGRATVRLTPSRSGKGRGQTRSLSARRPHSWQVPSPDIGSIKEERESDDGEDGPTGMTMSAPPSPEVVKTEMARPTPVPKPKKRVHWAF